MKKKSLKEEKLISKLIIDATNQHLNELLKDPKVQEYKVETDILIKEIERLEYINQLEIGNDGTIFFKENVKDTKEYSLEKILKQAITLKYLEFVNEYGIVSPEAIINIEIPYENLQNYIKNARNILNEMNYKSGDRQITNTYNLEVYNNPKNYIIFPNTEIELLRLHELIPTLNIHDQKSPVFLQKDKIQIKSEASKLPLEDYINLTEREKESFYGFNAMQILDIKPFDIEKKSSKPKTKKKQI